MLNKATREFRDFVWRDQAGDITRQAWNQIKGGANARDLEFAIEPQDALKVWQLQKGKCALSGVDLSFTSPKTASLDRIVNSWGYVRGNIQWVHKDLNIMKRDLLQSVFVGWCLKVAVEHLRQSALGLT